MLYIVATPIGNLSDMTFRAVETLKQVDYILCEDTRHSLPLLHHYEIQKRLQSFHKFNEASQQEEIIQDLSQGKNIALISDAGTPGISDPGQKLIKASIENGIKVIAIPGPCAAIAALCSSGLNTDRFQFYGFLPRKSGELRRRLQDILTYPGTTICYESPNRLLDVLDCINKLAPDRQLVVARELTKKFEELQRGTAQFLINYWEKAVLKGEVVLMIAGQESSSTTDWEGLTPQQHVAFMQEEYGLSKQEAIVAVAKMRDVSKRDIYNAIHQD